MSRASKILSKIEEYAVPHLGYSTLQDVIDAVNAEFPNVVSIKQTNTGITIDGINLQLPRDPSFVKAFEYDNVVVTQLRKNAKLMKIWNTVNKNYSMILNEIRKWKILDPNYINWSTVGPSDLQRFRADVMNMIDLLKKLPFDFDKVMKQYEVLRILFDRGYSSLHPAGL